MFRISLPLPRNVQPKAWGFGLFGLAIAFSLIDVTVRGGALFNGQGLGTLGRFVGAAFQPNLTVDFLLLTCQASLTTFAYAICGTFLSLVVGTIGGLLSARLLWETIFPQGKQLGGGIRLLLAVPRSIHEVVWGLILINIWGLDPVVALGAIAIPFGAIVAKIFAEIIDETPRAAFEALIYSGVPTAQAFLYGILPQALFNLLSYSFYRFECSLRSAAVLGIIGAGGLGYEIYLSLQSLRYEQLWTLFYALIALNGVVDWGSHFLRQRLDCTSRFDLNSHRYKLGGQRRDWLLGTMLFGSGLVAWGFWYIQPDWSRLWSGRGQDFLGEVITQLQTVSFDFAQGKQLAILSLQTLEMSILAIALAGVGGFFLAFLAAKNQRPIFWGQRLLSHLVLLVCRSIPAPIWALVVVFVMFPGTLPGAIALGIHNLGILGRLMGEVIENVPLAPLNALRNLGSSEGNVWLYGTVPLTLPNFIAYSFYRWEVCLRETVIVGLVGAGGLGRLLMEQLSSFNYGGVSLTLLCFLLLTWGVDSFSGFLRQQPR
ncbi:ABC transporter permease [Picosynechococcus sp. NKBG042902]|uniref:PhnE/PtxC family ABC transporter permease n=1 Tax=Picosynechococcus sp. NKBG042902 TaxID=490193 RepID=UPI0005EF7E17|nr:ABC transporter permease subunit [Picosynechococcus sp. NKBG042902]